MCRGSGLLPFSYFDSPRSKPTKANGLCRQFGGLPSASQGRQVVSPRRSLRARVELGAIMDLGAWLRSLGLEQYEAIFRKNAIDDTVLPDLTDQDLEKLGVLLGHRRKLLRAITNLENTEKDASGIIAVSAPPAVPQVETLPNADK